MSSIKTFNQSAPTAVNSNAVELDGKSWNFFPSLCVKPILFVSFMLSSPSSNQNLNTHPLITV